MTHWDIEPRGPVALVVVTREEPRGITHKRVMASVAPEDADRALAKLREKYGPSGERLPADVWERAGAAHSSHNQEAIMPKTKKKAPPKKKKKKKTQAKAKAATIPEAKLKEITFRLESGQSALIEESRALGFSNNDPLRAALRSHLGGVKEYRSMIERGMKARANAGAKTAAEPKAKKAKKTTRKKKTGK